MEPQLERITSLSSHLLKEIQPIYEDSFPEAERRDFSKLIHLLTHKEMCLYATIQNQTVVGFATIWEFENFYFLEHIATNKNIRGNGIGGKLLTSIIKSINSILIFEVELPNDITSQRRIAFYERYGFHLYTNFLYKQPSYDGIKPAIPMLLMSNNSTLTDIDLDNYTKRIKTDVYERFY